MVNQTLADFSQFTLAAAIAAYAVSFVLLVADLVFSSASREEHAGDPGPRRAGRAGMAVLVSAFALHLAGVVSRGAATYRVPWGNMYEFTMSGSCVVIAIFLAFALRRSALREITVYVVGAMLLMMLFAQNFWFVAPGSLIPALKSTLWLVIHVAVAVLATALFTLGAVVTVLQLVRSRGEERGSKSRILAKMPDSKELEGIAFRLNAFGFVLWGFTLIAGAIWARYAWGRFWNWDPKEVGTFVTWVAYAAYLHARATRGFRGRKAAYFALVGFLCLMGNYIVVNLFLPGLHSYSGV
ncbi:c-type cytochrome biogenesis protein CcsB [Dermabacteraceae bacterium TAE3-ERU27]|nr:c-type cytochrome biogenesis protein CcsB [Dermabacteraceae bacterium TAE3-ERU27]